jgi:hypothetical protein
MRQKWQWAEEMTENHQWSRHKTEKETIAGAAKNVAGVAVASADSCAAATCRRLDFFAVQI